MPAAAEHPASHPYDPDGDELVGLQRLGDSVGWGECLLSLLEADGWRVHRRRAFAGDGVLLIATHPDGYDLRAGGPSIAAAASPLFIAAVQIRPGRGDDRDVVF